MRAVEKYYTVAQTAMLLELAPKTVILNLPQMGAVIDLAKKSPEDEPKSHDYRIPASGLNDYIAARRLFLPIEDLEGITARTTGELRRKAAA